MNPVWLLVTTQLSLAETAPIRPVGGSLWDYIESNAISQGLEPTSMDGLSNSEFILPQMILGQSIGNVDR